MKSKKQWYLIAYDIRDPKRLKRLHYYVSKSATALQNSVFIIKVNQSAMDEMIKGMKKRTNDKVDDIRIYPVAHPASIWTSGKQSGALQDLYPDRLDKKSTLKSFIESLFKRKKRSKDVISY